MVNRVAYPAARDQRWSRRDAMKGLGALAGGTGFLSLTPRSVMADPAPETKHVRLVRTSLCVAPLYIAEELLRVEGFSKVEYLDDDPREIGTSKLIATGAADLNMSFGLTTLIRVDAGEPVVMLAGVHAGCYELFTTDRLRSIKELHGRRVAIPGFGSTHHVFLSVIASYVGIDPRREISWVVLPDEEAKRALAAGAVDAYLGFPPAPQELRTKRVGRVMLNSSTDHPWAQYFCCMVVGNQDFVRRNPVATKRALRALLKATDVCAKEPARSAQFLVDRGYTDSRDYALQTLTDVPYGRWREYSPEDSVRFFGLRLREVEMVKSTPQKLIAKGTDWRFLNELARELKVNGRAHR